MGNLKSIDERINDWKDSIVYSQTKIAEYELKYERLRSERDKVLEQMRELEELIHLQKSELDMSIDELSQLVAKKVRGE